ncbi:hypothetical protein, partial [Candidatus Ventrimonas sp.]|uniref:hypothetical protein n=1 Tax=Candidatus Ventrimonas sp. TaxID=3048889 RepID=UPI003AB3EBE2
RRHWRLFGTPSSAYFFCSEILCKIKGFPGFFYCYIGSRQFAVFLIEISKKQRYNRITNAVCWKTGVWLAAWS